MQENLESLVELARVVPPGSQAQHGVMLLRQAEPCQLLHRTHHQLRMLVERRFPCARRCEVIVVGEQVRLGGPLGVGGSGRKEH